MTMVGGDDFKIIKGKDVLTLYQYHTKVAEHYFCSKCGIHTHNKPRSNPKIYGIPHQITEEIEQVISASEVDHSDFVQQVGKACRYSGTFQGALHAVLKASSYEEGVRLSILAGGCNCSRSIQVGSLLGAIHGEEKIPKEWLDKTDSVAEIQNIVGKLTLE